MVKAKTQTEQSVQTVKSGHKRVLQGVVVSDKMQKTIVVKVDRQVRHREYKKYLVQSEKYMAHDDKEQASIGDRVEIIESRPLSAKKRWALRRIVARTSVQAAADLGGGA